jgi:hypothetical protein
MNVEVVSRSGFAGVAPAESSIFHAGSWEAESVLISPNSRYFVRHEFTLRPQRDAGAALPFIDAGKRLDVADILEQAIKAGKAVLQLKKNDAIRLTKLEMPPGEEIAILLFRRSDPDAATPIFEHRKTKKLRPADKKADEAEAISAHLFIHLDRQVAECPTYRSIMEEVPGLGRSYMQTILKTILRDNKYPYDDGRGDTKETYTIPEFEGLRSESLGDALKSGEIKYVELVRPPKVTGLDVAGLIPHPERMRFTVKATSRTAMLAAIGRLKTWSGNHDWPGLRVRVGTGDDRSRVVDIARTQDAADVLFVRSEMVTTKNPLDQCTETVNDELVAHAKKMFADVKSWK